MDIGGFKIGAVVVGEYPDHPAWSGRGSEPVVGLLLNGSPFFANVLTGNCTETSLAPASLRLATDAERDAWWRALEPQLVDTADNIIPDGVRDFMARNGE